MRNQQSSFSTLAIHHGYNPMDHEGALTPPLHLTSTFAFETAEAGGEMFAGEQAGHIYSRISNPTTALLEERIAVLEGGEAGLLWLPAWERAQRPCGPCCRRVTKLSWIRRYMAAPLLTCATASPNSVSL